LRKLYCEAFPFRKCLSDIKAVAQAHKATFRWIFADHEESDIPWHNFVDWLQQGEHINWITGKAASGKSTLMKYINWEEVSVTTDTKFGKGKTITKFVQNTRLLKF
jgi:ABC-type lipoprotein export system ATPase subunit